MSWIDDRKPEQGSAEEAECLAAFAVGLGRLGWFEGLRGLGSDSLLLIDPEVQSAIENICGTIGAACQVPQLPETVPGGVKRIYVLSRRREWQLTKALRNRFSDMPVISLVYDVMPLGFLEGESLPDGPFDDQAADLDAPDRLILSHAGADIEYLGLTTESSGIGPIRRLAPNALVYWLLLADSFRLLRFTARSMHVVRQLGVIPWLDIVLLQLLRWHGGLSFESFVEWGNEHGSRVIYFASRDAIRQAAVCEVLREELHESFWDRSEGTVSQLGVDAEAARIEERTLVTLCIDSVVERSIQDFDKFKMVTLDELVISGGLVLEAIGQFWGMQIAPPLKLPDWTARYKAVPGFIGLLHDTRDRLRDKFGLD